MALASAVIVVTASGEVRAELPVQRTFFKLASSNGFGAVMVDLEQSKLTHFREHSFATEEPQIDASGQDLWAAGQPAVVRSRDLLYDAYFGLRVDGAQAWLTKAPVDLDASGYAPWAAGKTGGTGVVTMVQHVGDIEATTFAFAPNELEHAGFVMALRVRNTGSAEATSVGAFSLHNLHLGFGRPGVNAEIGEEGETVVFDATRGDFLERAFAGVVALRPLGSVVHHGASNAASLPTDHVFAIVDGGGAADLPDLDGTSAVADGWVTAFQFDVGDVAPGEERWVGVAIAHHGDPFAGETAEDWLDAYVKARDVEALVTAELEGWKSFQLERVVVPASVGGDDESLLRHSATTLKMAQVREDHAFLREFLTKDGEPRLTRFGATLDAPPSALPATIAHRGKGAMLASLPPGEWTYAWIRDGAYATAAMARLGMAEEAKSALGFYLGAEAGRFQAWDELAPYAMPPYRISLVRYHGFGVEETDVNDFGPNLEFDGFGLFLWALREYELATGDTSVADASWNTVATEVADVLVALVDPTTGLLRRDSSIWESHWKGRERSWTYTNVTAVRGLCDAAAIAERRGDDERMARYRDAATELRAAIADKLTDASGALASNAEELASGQGYWDASVLDAIAFGLFDPDGAIARATLDALDEHLAAPAGAGWSRNDDRTDHGGAEDLSPWGSAYDSAEWVVTDLRGAIATRLAGDAVRSDRLITWVREQSLANYLAVAETYDEATGKYEFNAPMVGFGAGVYALAVLQREGTLAIEPACGAWFDEGGGGAGGGGAGPAGGGGPSGSDVGGDDGGCGCRTTDGPAPPVAAQVIAAAVLLAARRRRHARSRVRCPSGAAARACRAELC